MFEMLAVFTEIRDNTSECVKCYKSKSVGKKRRVFLVEIHFRIILDGLRNWIVRSFSGGCRYFRKHPYFMEIRISDETHDLVKVQNVRFINKTK